MISGQGRNAEILIVGDYGTEEDYVNGKALTGSQETVLKQLFANHGFKLENCYRTLYIKDRLSYYGKVKSKRKLAIKEAFEKADYNKILEEEIVELKPSVIAPVGDLALKFLIGDRVTSIHKLRGSVLPLTPALQDKIGKDRVVRVIPTLPPIFLNQDWTARVYCSLDVEKIVSNRSNFAPILQKELIWIAKNAESLRVYLNRIKDCEFITLDIETYCGIPTCIGFCHDGYEGVCVPLLDSDIDVANRVLMWQLVGKVLASNIPKVNQNIKYDQTILERFNFKVNKIVFDTQIAAGILYPELPKNLGFLASIYTDMPYFKDEGKEFDPTIHSKSRLYIYNAKDAISTWQVTKKQEEELIEFGLKNLYYGQGLGNKEPEENPAGLIKLYHIYQKMDKRGIQIDETARQNLIKKYTAILTVYETLLRNKIGNSAFNFNSPSQVGLLVYEDLKFPMRKKLGVASGKHSYNTEEEVIEDLYLNFSDQCTRQDGAEILETILFIRKIYRVLQTLDTPIHSDYRMRQNSNLSGTNTGRTSGNKTFDEIFAIEECTRFSTKIKRVRLGHSLQTIGKHGFKYQNRIYGEDLRQIYVPSPGCILVESDLSQAEARVDAVLAGDYDILPRFDDGVGIHRLTGSWVFECKPEEIKKNTEEYFISKVVRHAAERNLKAPHLSLLIHKPLSFCRDLLEKFHSTQPKIRAIFHTDIINFVRKNRYLRCPNGRRRDFFGRPSDSMFNDAISFLPQGIVTDQNKFTMIPFWEDNEDFPWLYEGHDATMCELPKDAVMPFAERYKRIVERPIDFRTCSLSRDFELKIPVEIQASETNWMEMEELKI